MQKKSPYIVPTDYSSPYQKSTFKEIWSNHFQPNKKNYDFDCFKGVSFIRKERFPLFINIGATNTKGINYAIDHSHLPNKIGSSVYLLYDVPNYNCNKEQKINGLKLKTIPQYEGFICNLAKSNSVEEYLQGTISKRSRSKLRNYTNKFHKSFEVTYKMVWGNLSDKEYESLFDQFHGLLVQRFEDKQIVNNNLNPIEWAFFKDVTLPMMRSKEAGLFVTYLKDRPITITLLNFSGSHAYDVIRVFDIEFTKYRIGSISIMHQIDWCIKNNFKALDFSKGFYDYKKRWSTDSYMLDYHIWYNPKNLTSLSIASFLILKFKLKYWARKHGLLEVVHKIRYKMGAKP